MNNTEPQALLRKLSDLIELSLDVRFGQLLADLGFIGRGASRRIAVGHRGSSLASGHGATLGRIGRANRTESARTFKLTAQCQERHHKRLRGLDVMCRNLDRHMRHECRIPSRQPST